MAKVSASSSLRLNTGFRRAELLSLTWQDVDFERGLVTVQAAYAKNGERRSIPMNRKLRTLFEERKITGPKSSKLFLNRHGEAYKLATTVFNDAIRRAGIENFHFHDLRHTFASRLVMRGVDLRTIQALMGHKTINMTLRYAHLAPDHLKRAVEVLDNEKSHNNFHNTPHLPKTPRPSKLLKSQDWRRKAPGGAAGLQNQSGGRKVPGGFDSLPSPPRKFLHIQQLTFALCVCSPSVAQIVAVRGAIIDFYGSCDETPNGTDQVQGQKLEAQHRFANDYED